MTLEEKYNDVCKILIQISEELELYKNALDWLAGRCEVLDKMANPDYKFCFTANCWKHISLQKAREQK